jgi:hypothetical protein
MDSQHASSGEHPKIIGPPSPENKLQTVLAAVGKPTAQPYPSRLVPTLGASLHPETSPRRTSTRT